jgi:glutaryl-CoA dehydrogenase
MIIMASAAPDMNSGKKISPASFRWDDPLLLGEQLTEEERMIRDTARQYAQE